MKITSVEVFLGQAIVVKVNTDEGISGFLVSHGSSTVPQEYVQQINAMGGATITSSAVTNAVNAALYFVQNCSAAQ